MKKSTKCFICGLPVETQEHRLCPACKCLEDLLPKSVQGFDIFVNRLIRYRVNAYRLLKCRVTQRC